MLDLHYQAHQVRFHYEKAVSGWRTTIFHAWWCGKHLLKVKSELNHGGWLVWLRANFPGHRKTASNWMRLAKIKREVLEENAHITVRDALESLGSGGGKGVKGKNTPEDLARAKLLKLLLEDAWKDWTQEEINWLASDMEYEDEDSAELELLFARAVNAVRKAIQRRMRMHELEVTRRTKYSTTLVLQPWPNHASLRRLKQNRPSQARAYLGQDLCSDFVVI